MTAGVVGAISPKLQQAEIDRARESRPRIYKPTTTTFVELRASAALGARVTRR